MSIEVELPDGNVVEFPDDTPRHVMEAALKQYAARPIRKRSPQDIRDLAGARDPTEGMSFAAQVGAGFGKSFVDTAQGARQLYAEVADRVAPRQQTIADLVAGRDNSRAAAMQREVDATRRQDASLSGSPGGFTGNVAGQTTQAFVPIPGGQLAWAGRAAPYVRAAISGGVLSGIQPVATGESRAQNTAIGAAAGVAGQGILSGLGSAARAARARMPLPVRESIKAARQEGIPLHTSQVTDSRFLKTMGSVANQLPLSGAAAAARKQQSAFNRAVSRTFGHESPSLSDDVMEAAGNKLNQGYDRLFAGKKIALDRQGATEMLRLRNSLDSELESEPREVVRKQMARLFDNLDNNGEMPGKVYQSLRSEWGKKFPKGTDKGRVLGEARKILDEAAARSLGPSEAMALKRLNSMWANFRTTKDALKQVAGAGGDVRPASLYPLVRKGSTPEMRKLAQMGQNVLKDPIPDSGTTGRMIAAGALGAGATGGVALPALAKMALSGAVVGRTMNSNGLSKLLEQGKPLTGLSRLAAPAPKALPALANNWRVASIMAAASQDPDKGPEILANLSPEDQAAAIEQFAQKAGLSPAEVARRVQIENARLERLR